MEDSRRMVGWMMHYFLREHYGDSRSRMAKAMGLSRHTLWRALKAIDTGQGKVSTLVVQQLLWCCVQNEHSFDEAISRYLLETGELDPSSFWARDPESAKKRAVTYLMLAKRLATEVQGILDCKAEIINVADPEHCPYTTHCPVNKLITLTQEIANYLIALEPNPNTNTEDTNNLV